MELLFEKINERLKHRGQLRVLLFLLIFAAGAACIYFSGSLIFELYSNRHEIQTRLVNGTISDARRIDKIGRTIEQTIGDISALMEERRFNEKQLIDLLNQRNSSNPCRYSLNFIFDDASAVQQKMTAPALTHTLDMLNVKVFDSPDAYAKRANISASDSSNGWKNACWSIEDQGVVVSYQRRFCLYDNNGRKVSAGMVSARLRIDDVQKAMAACDMGSYGYRFLIDRNGQAISHPIQKLLKESFNMLDYAAKSYSAGNNQLVHQVFRNHLPASIEEVNIISGQRSLIRFEPVASTGWVTGMTMLMDELSIPNRVLKESMLLVLTSFILLLLLVWIYLLIFSPSAAVFANRFMRYSWLISALFMIGLGCIWALQITRGNHSPYEDGCITSHAQIESFMHQQMRKTLPFGAGKENFIRTGLFIRSAHLSESIESIDLTGFLWQRIPQEMDLEQCSGFRFPDEIETKKEELFRIMENGTTIIGWNFFTRIRQDFKSRIYPFDRINVNLRMRQPKTLGSTLFIPDLDAYAMTSPSAKSLLVKNFQMHGWQIDNTYFRFNTDNSDSNINYGRQAAMGGAGLEELVMVISISRDWIGSFVSVLIPVIAIFSILYSSIYMITNDADGRKVFNFDAMRTSAIGSAFTLFLVIAIQNIRGTIIPEEILYVEKIYFLIYFAILANVVIAIRVTEKRGFFLSHKNGFIVRYLFWPLYMALLYVITLIEFY